jgi:hypothetical protein
MSTCSDDPARRLGQARIRKNGNWTNEQLQSALAELDDGVSIRESASRNHLLYSSFRNWCYGKIRSRDWGMKGVLTPMEEEQLVQYFLQMCDRDLGLSPTKLKIKVYEITKNQWTPF